MSLEGNDITYYYEVRGEFRRTKAGSKRDKPITVTSAGRVELDSLMGDAGIREYQNQLIFDTMQEQMDKLGEEVEVSKTFYLAQWCKE